MFLEICQNKSTQPALLITFTSFQLSSDFTSSKSTKKIVRKFLMNGIAACCKITNSITITEIFQGEYGNHSRQEFCKF